MRVVALISGGKDSCYNMMQCISAGHEIVALANIIPDARTEIDSYMYQSVGFEAIEFIAKAMDLPLYQVSTKGISLQVDKNYVPTNNDEVEDLYQLLENVKTDLNIEGVSSGAILSDYQRIRVENVCIRLGLVSLAYLWQRKQEELLKEMIKCEIDAIIVKVAAIGLDPQRHLGRSIRLLEPHLLAMHEKYGLNVCGEGGEYETLTLDCPLYKNRIVLEESEIIEGKDAIATVGYLKLKKVNLELKLPLLDLEGRFINLPLKNSDGYITDPGEEAVDLVNVKDDIKLNNSPITPKDLSENGEINQPDHFFTSGCGWLYVGGISSHSKDSCLAFKECLEKLKSSLEQSNQSLSDICSISMYIADLSEYAELNKLYCETLNHINPPTRACVQVPLPSNCPVILEAISWKKTDTSGNGDNNVERNTIHVQSISHWCPANIGPYSQAIKIGDVIYLAGMIALVPGSMEMVKGGIQPQCKLSLRHIERLIKAIDANCDLRNVVQGLCYLTDSKYIANARKFWEEKTNNAIVDYVVVTSLPRGALVEWHVWAHTHNHQFEYEETGQCVQDWSISIFRRCNYENNIAAVVCHVSNSDLNTILSASIVREAIEYALQKLNQGHEYDPNSVCNLKIFYSISKVTCAYSFVSIFEEYRRAQPLVYTIIPANDLNTKNTFLSIYGVRNQ